MGKRKILEIRNKILEGLAGKLKGFYLAGGTALSLFYFQHRESYDLDFFTKEFSAERIDGIIRNVNCAVNLKSELIAEQNKPGFAKIRVYSLAAGKDDVLKIDFIEDIYKLLKPLKSIDGVPVLSIEDIYFRKIIAACGSIPALDITGRKVFTGGRQEAKDFFDLYFLSNTFMPLSGFAVKYCTQPQIESVVIWYRTYDRTAIKLGAGEIVTDKKIDFAVMERHFRLEVEQLIKQEIS